MSQRTCRFGHQTLFLLRHLWFPYPNEEEATSVPAIKRWGTQLKRHLLTWASSNIPARLPGARVVYFKARQSGSYWAMSNDCETVFAELWDASVLVSLTTHPSLLTGSGNSSLTNGVDGNSSDSSLASKSGTTISSLASKSGTNISSGGGNSSSNNVANKSSKHSNNNHHHHHNNHPHLNHHHHHSNGAVEPPRSISRDRLSDASTHSGSNQGYVLNDGTTTLLLEWARSALIPDCLTRHCVCLALGLETLHRETVLLAVTGALWASSLVAPLPLRFAVYCSSLASSTGLALTLGWV
ncbi:hypothetical protein EGW08_023319 [Elysia chlorotica]|uniref:Uncharacterized protein n=1 Tax=Elysia chlorotica TaxID=188477 RepID=A0A3S1GYX8_ELYCH|nr:hypothetical protein EGW08_023319 [Elysia chlorotica]